MSSEPSPQHENDDKDILESIESLPNVFFNDIVQSN